MADGKPWINDAERAKTLEFLYQKLCQFVAPAPGPQGGAAPHRDADQRWALAQSVERQILQQARSRADYAQQMHQRVQKLSSGSKQAARPVAPAPAASASARAHERPSSSSQPGPRASPGLGGPPAASMYGRMPSIPKAMPLMDSAAEAETLRLMGGGDIFGGELDGLFDDEAGGGAGGADALGFGPRGFPPDGAGSYPAQGAANAIQQLRNLQVPQSRALEARMTGQRPQYPHAPAAPAPAFGSAPGGARDPKAAFVAMVKAADEGQRQVVLAFMSLSAECRGQFLQPLVSGLKTAKAYINHLDAEIKGGQLPPETLVHSKLAMKKVKQNYDKMSEYLKLVVVLETRFIKHGRMPTAQDYAEFRRGMEKLRQNYGKVTQFFQYMKTQLKEALQRRSDAGRAAPPVERSRATKVVSGATQAKGPPQVGRKPEPEQGSVPAKTGGGAAAAAPAAQGLGTPAEDGQRLPAVQARLAAGLKVLDPAGREFLQAVSRNALHAGDGADHKLQKVGFREEALWASRGAPSRD